MPSSRRGDVVGERDDLVRRGEHELAGVQDERARRPPARPAGSGRPARPRGRCAGSGGSRTPGSTGRAARRCWTAAPWIRRTGSMRTRPESISARMSLSERSTPRGYARRAAPPQSDDPRACAPRATCVCPGALPTALTGWLNPERPAAATGPTARYRPSAYRLLHRLAPAAPSATGTACRSRAHRGHRISRPGPIRSAPSCCIGNEVGAEDVPFGTTDNGALHRSII